MLGMETIWKNIQSVLGEPENSYLQIFSSHKRISMLQVTGFSSCKTDLNLLWSLLNCRINLEPCLLSTACLWHLPGSNCINAFLNSTGLKEKSTAKKMQPFCGLHPQWHQNPVVFHSHELHLQKKKFFVQTMLVYIKTWDWDETRGGPERGLPGRGDGDWENSADWGRDLRSSEEGLNKQKAPPIWLMIKGRNTVVHNLWKCPVAVK